MKVWIYTNDQEVTNLGIKRPPAKPAKSNVTLEHLSRALIEEFANDGDHYQSTHVKQSRSCYSQSLENDV